MTQNWLAVFVLFAWPLVAFALFNAMPPSRALLWVIFGAQLFLPAGAAIKFPMIPAVDKTTVPNVAALLGALVVARRIRRPNGFGLTEVLIITFTMSPLVTAQLNGDLLILEGAVLPSVGLYDGASTVIGQCLALIPFLLGRRLLSTPESNIDIFRVLTIGGLIYSPLLLFEIRMSPQLQAWIYGFMPGEFYQEIRGGTFRPVVFMGHGLVTAFFAMASAVAACTLWRGKISIRKFRTAPVAAYLAIVLVLCRSFGATLYAMFLLPLIGFARPRTQIIIAVLLALLALGYPALRLAEVFPTNTIVDTVAAINQDRALSLQTRFQEEDKLLARALERPFFGWGRFGRSRVHTESGFDISITDGRWIVTIGQFGIVGFLSEFGLLALSVIRTISALRYVQSRNEGIFLAALSLLVVVNIIELIPNSTLSPWTWLLAGSLLGRTEQLQLIGGQFLREKRKQLSATFNSNLTSRPN